MRSVVRSLRHKLGDAAADPIYIFTEPRVGYRMALAEAGPVNRSREYLLRLISRPF